MARLDVIHYVALIRKEEGTDYWIDIPDMPGCVTSGKSWEEALVSMEEALDIHLNALYRHGKELPSARNMRDVLAHETDSYVEAYVIEVEPREGNGLSIDFNPL